jgi:NitT/TauT family transport system substrate-binding protein
MKMKRILSTILVSLMFCLMLSQSAFAATNKVKLGLQPWLGYGPWWIAQEKGFFEKHDLDVEVINFTWDADMAAGIASGNLDVIAAATNFLISTRNQDIDLKGFLILDASYEADAILAPASVMSIADLKGKSVAFESGATSDLLINYALKQNGMTTKDVKATHMAAADAGLALIAGRVDAAVTYEPYISAALKQGQGYKVLYTAAEQPGLISDLAVASSEFIAENPETIKKLILAWNDAVTYLNNEPEIGGKIIADAVHSPMDEFKVAMEGVRVYDLQANNQAFEGDFQKTMMSIGQIMKATNPENIKNLPVPAKALAIEYVQGLSQ